MMKSAGTAFAVVMSFALLQVPLSAEPGNSPQANSEAKEALNANRGEHTTVDEARRQAEVLHAAVHSTLQAVHHHYYREDEGLPLPAALLKDVFAELEKEQHVQLRWLAVEGQAMNTDHIARDAFEIEAAKALKSGRKAFEHVENGVYRRAGSIVLLNHCLKCHVPDRKSTENRTAGLIIAIPISE